MADEEQQQRPHSNSQETTTTTTATTATAAASSSNSNNDPNEGCCFLSPCLRLFHGNREALGWCFDVVGRTLSIIAIGAFLMPAMLYLAQEAAGCTTTIEQCDNKIYGIKPSSLLTSTNTIVSVCTSPLMPLMGAMIDYTSHRLLVGRFFSVFFLALLFPLIFVSEQTWFPLAIVMIFEFFIFIFQMVAAYAYLPELSEDRNKVNAYTRNFTVITFASVVVYTAVIVGITGGLGIQSDAVLVAKIAVSVVFVINAILWWIAWTMLFQPRPPLHELPANQSIWTAGFYKLYHSCRKIFGGCCANRRRRKGGGSGGTTKVDGDHGTDPHSHTMDVIEDDIGMSEQQVQEHSDYHALKWFYIAIMFGDGAITPLMSILITFGTEVLEFTSMDTGVAVLILLIANVPAGFLAATVTKYTDPRISSISSIILVIIMTSLSVALLHGPDQKSTAFVLVFFWGLGIGWKWTSDRMMSATVTPPRQSSEFMGIYLFFGSILTWLPPLIFTSLNEAGISQNIGLASLNAFFLLALCSYCMMGSYTKAVENISSSVSSTIAQQPLGVSLPLAVIPPEQANNDLEEKSGPKSEMHDDAGYDAGH